MNCTVAIDEKQLLYIIHEYLEQAGHTECQIALENELKDEVKPRVPEDLVFVRSLCLKGHWEDVVECVKAFESCRESGGYLYEVYKQWYLETLSGKLPRARVQGSEESRVKLLSSLLSKLKELCPSKQNYTALLSLLDLPSPTASPDYTSWKLFPARMGVFQTIVQWISKFIYPGVDPRTLLEPHQADLVGSQLVQLVAKGLLYQKCEGIALHRCPGDKREEGSEMFDLCGWMQQQPDSAYQVPPASCQLTFHPLSVDAMSERVSVDGTAQTVTQHVSSKSSLKIAQDSIAPVSRAVCEEGDKAPPNPTSGPVRPSCSAPHSGTTTDVRVASEPAVTTATSMEGAGTDNAATVSSKETRTVDSAPSKPVLPSPAPSLVLPPQRTSGIRVSETHSSHGEIQVMEAFEDNFTTTSPSSQNLQPQVKSGRDSSTPKPSSTRLHLHPSPPTSPVGVASPHLEENGIDGGTYSVTHQQREGDNRTTPPKEVKGRVEFSDSPEDMSIEWPTATLLSTVQDTQAVRSVAFSRSGGVVAVGANSRTLRLCSTTTLLEGRPCEELPVFYHHASYHKGSIYCLAWSGDTLLASGSNDHKLRLLSYHPSSESPCKSLGDLNIHSGTIRDLAFTPSGLLVSGGAIDTAVKVTDLSTRQVVASLSGHTEQVLALDAFDNNLIMSGSQDRAIILWDLRQRGPVWSMECPHAVTSISLNPYRNEFVSSHSDGSCSIGALRTSSTRLTYHPHSDDCRSVRWSPRTGQWILSGSYDGTVCVCEGVSGEWQQVCGHKDKVVQVRWHGGGGVFATTGADKRACFWTLS